MKPIKLKRHQSPYYCRAKGCTNKPLKVIGLCKKHDIEARLFYDSTEK